MPTEIDFIEPESDGDGGSRVPLALQKDIPLSALATPLADVATSNDYADLDNRPALGTAADNDEGDFATAAQGTKADTAVQPADLAAYAPATGAYAVNTVAASGATETLTLAPAHDVTMDEDCVFTFPSPTAGHTFLLRVSGAFTPTFPAAVVWNEGAAPTYATPSLYGFTSLDGGTTWIGSLIASSLA